MAFIQENSPQQDAVEFYEFTREHLQRRQKQLDRREEELNEREQRIKQREIELWQDLPYKTSKPKVTGPIG
mgnify:FL=1